MTTLFYAILILGAGLLWISWWISRTSRNVIPESPKWIKQSDIMICAYCGERVLRWDETAANHGCRDDGDGSPGRNSPQRPGTLRSPLAWRVARSPRAELPRSGPAAGGCSTHGGVLGQGIRSRGSQGAGGSPGPWPQANPQPGAAHRSRAVVACQTPGQRNGRQPLGWPQTLGLLEAALGGPTGRPPMPAAVPPVELPLSVAASGSGQGGPRKAEGA